jgi:hypothetical protein
MRRISHYSLLLVALLLSAVSFGQSNEYMTDTVVQAAPPVEDAEMSSFDPITQVETIEVRKLPANKVSELKKDDAYWYANQEPEKKKAEAAPVKEEGLVEKDWFQNLLWIIILCSFIGVVVWYLASSNIRLFSRDAKKLDEEETPEETTDDIFAIQYDREIQKAVEAKNYRLAIRLWYLKTLRELSERNIIDYQHGKTNSHYVNSLYGSRYYKDFFRLTRNFEYTWYGQFDLSAEGYEMMRNDFSNFKNSLA